MKRKILAVLSVSTVACFGLSYAFSSLAGLHPHPTALANKYIDEEARKYPVTDDHRIYEHASIRRIEMQMVSAEIRVIPSKSDRIELSYRMRGTPSILEKMDGDVLKLKEDIHEGGISYPRASVDSVEIRIPAQVRELKFKSVSGEIDIIDVAIDEMKAETVSGTIRIAGNPEKVKCKSVSGDVNINIPSTAPKIEVETISGDVALSLKKRAEAEVEFSSASGTYTQYKNGGHDTYEHHFSDQWGTGKGTIKLKTVSGDVTARLE